MPLPEPAGVYRPRHPERTAVYRLFEEHFERYVRKHEERYEPREGSLRKVVSTTVEAYLACGRLEGGFARIRCPNCRAEHLLASSCLTRNFCPSCQAKRSVLFAEHVMTQILEPVPHRHVVLTIPRVLRGLFQRERRLLGLLARAARDAIVPSVRTILDRHDVTPGLVLSIQTFGSYADIAAMSTATRTSTSAASRKDGFRSAPHRDILSRWSRVPRAPSRSPRQPASVRGVVVPWSPARSIRHELRFRDRSGRARSGHHPCLSTKADSSPAR